MTDANHEKYTHNGRVVYCLRISCACLTYGIVIIDMRESRREETPLLMSSIFAFRGKPWSDLGSWFVRSLWSTDYIVVSEGEVLWGGADDDKPTSMFIVLTLVFLGTFAWMTWCSIIHSRGSKSTGMLSDACKGQECSNLLPLYFLLVGQQSGMVIYIEKLLFRSSGLFFI